MMLQCLLWSFFMYKIKKVKAAVDIGSNTVWDELPHETIFQSVINSWKQLKNLAKD